MTDDSNEVPVGLPLEGMLVLEFSEHMAGELAGLRLAEFGARVIKIERPYRDRYRHTKRFALLNRNKESFALDLNNSCRKRSVCKLIEEADILIVSHSSEGVEDWQPDYEMVQSIHPQAIYGRITGYGACESGEVQPDDELDDLFVQCISGMPWLNGNSQDPPIPFPIPIVEKFTGFNLVQGILAALVSRFRSGKGMLVEISLLESAIDLQFELFTTYLNDGNRLPERSQVSNAHVYLAAPYGIYETKSGYLALAMGSVIHLAKLLNCETLTQYTDPSTWFTHRDEIKRKLAAHLKIKTASQWVDILEQGGYWCMKVQTVDDLLRHEGFLHLNVMRSVKDHSGRSFVSLCCPIRIDGKRLFAGRGVPSFGKDTESIEDSLDPI